MPIGIPPWIQAADPAQYAAHGLQIGAQIGAQQAAQRFQEQQMQRKQQEDAQAQARWEAEYGLQAQAAARKHQAMQQYQQRISGGEDPMKVLMEIGPAAGLPGAMEAAAIRAQQIKPQRTIPMPTVEFADVAGQKVPYLVDRATGRGTWAPSGALSSGKPKQGMTDFQRMNLIRGLEKDADKIRGENSFDIEGDMDPAWSKATVAKFKSAKDRYSKIAEQIRTLESGGEAGGAAPGGLRILSISPADAQPTAQE
jgi:hypothetical protein